MEEFRTTCDSIIGIPKFYEIVTIPTSNMGMQGELLPYKMESDEAVIGALLLSFLLIIIAMQNESKSFWRLFKGCFTSSERASIFDENNNTSQLPVAVLCSVAGILGGVCFYHYFSYSDSYLFGKVGHPFLLSIYIVILLAFIGLKIISYSFINWIFFDKENIKKWRNSLLNIIATLGFVLFPVLLYIVFLDSELHFSTLLIIIIIGLSKILLFYKCLKHFFFQFHGFLHLILYFCALEIVPDLLLWKGIELINSILILKF
ncbi:MAG: DUF4271 domain-containing protein [Phocaeicola sp.]|nr:DUF4271 domain-containing protein [Phocaeicola sp.]